MTTPMTFSQFQATRREVPDLGDLLKDECLAGHHGFLYVDCLYIDTVGSDWPAAAQQEGKYHLLLGNSETISDDLLTLERTLYAYGIAEGDVGKPAIDLDALTGLDLYEAARTRDLDEAVAKLQDKAGIMTGDIAGMVFAGFEWSSQPFDVRADKIKEWIETERSYAADMAVEEAPGVDVLDYDLGNGWRVDWIKAKPGIGTSIYAEHETMTLRDTITRRQIVLAADQIDKLRAIFESVSRPVIIGGDPLLSVREEDGKEQCQIKLSEWLEQAREVYDPGDLDAIEELIRAGNTYRVDMNLGSWIDLVPIAA